MKLSRLSVFCLLILVATTIFAQTETEKGVEFYRKGQYKNALETLKRVAKTEPNNAQVWYFLGLSQMADDKMKDAEKSLKKSVTLDSGDALAHSALAYVHILRNNQEKARESAAASLKLDKRNIDAQYVLGVIAFRDGFYNRSYDYARNVLKANPSYTNAHLLKAESLISSFIKQAGTVLLPTNQRAELLREARNDLEKYVSLAPQSKDINFYKEYLDSIGFFADYYAKTGASIPSGTEANEKPEPDTVELKILSKPRAEYSSAARQAGVAGTITLLVNFSEDGKVRNILVLKSLGFGLDQEAIYAARKIKFEPRTRDGKPVSVVKMVQYTFTLY